jgi:hypothetical protein
VETIDIEAPPRQTIQLIDSRVSVEIGLFFIRPPPFLSQLNKITYFHFKQDIHRR